MLEYEKRLHLDEHYKKIQERNIGSRVGSVIGWICTYLIVMVLCKLLQNVIPDWQPWNNGEKCFQMGNIFFYKADIIYQIVGLFLYIIEAVRLSNITYINHSVRKKEDEIPQALITNGYYSKSRHPMYGTFIMLYAALLFAIRSIWGIAGLIIMVIGQYINALLEERRVLTKVFGREYSEYKNKVKRLVLTPIQIGTVIVLIVCNIIGFLVS